MFASRRQFLGLLAAPAILRVTKPMALWVPKPLWEIDLGSDDRTVLVNVKQNTILSIHEITREAVRLWKEHYVTQVVPQYRDIFEAVELERTI